MFFTQNNRAIKFEIIMNSFIMKHRCAFVGILIILTSFQIIFAQNGMRLTLSDAIQIAIKNNRDIAVLQKDIEKSESEIQTASRVFNRNPELSGAVKDRMRSNGQSDIDFGLSMDLPIEIRGQRYYRRQIAETNLSKAKLQLQKKKIEITEKIKMLFVELTASSQKNSSIKDLLKVEEDLFNWMKVRANYGEISQVAMNTVNLEVLNTQEQQIAIEQAITAKRNELAWEMNYTIPESAEIVYEWQELPAVPEFEILANYAKKNNPDLAIASADEKIADAELNLIKGGAIFPEITPSIEFSREDNDNIFGVGLSFPLPIFNRKNAEIHSAKTEQEISALQKKNIEGKIISDLRNKCRMLKFLKERREIYTGKILPIAQQNLDETKILYQKGELDLPTLERFWDNWIQAKMDYADFLAEYYHTICEIEILVGKDLKELDKK